MARRRTNQAEDIAKAIGGMLVLIVLVAGGTQALNSVANLLRGAFFVSLGIALLTLCVWGLRCWMRRDGEARDVQGEARWTINQARERIRGIEQPTGSCQINWQRNLRALDWYQFEKLVEQHYRQQGHVVFRSGGAKPDGGIDLVAEKDGVRLAVQCKHWRNQPAGVSQLRELLGAMTDRGIKRGAFVALSGYTIEARDLANRHGILLMQDLDLVAWLQTAKMDAELHACLNDKEKRCPKCEAAMVLRTAKKGHVGEQFWGCSSYPSCRAIVKLQREMVS